MSNIEKDIEQRWVRSCVTIIALTYLAEIAVNYLMFPLMSWLHIPDYTEGSLGAELQDMITYLIVFALPLAVAAHLCGMRPKELIGRSKPTASVYIMTAGLTMGWNLAAGWAAAAIEQLLNMIGLTEPSDPYIVPISAAAAIVQFISLAIVPPIVEELCFRGFYLNLTVRSMGTWGAIVFTALLFWMAHYSLEMLPLAFGFGVISGYVRRRYGSLLPSIVAHFTVNSIYFVVNYSYLFGDRIGTILYLAVMLLELAMGAVGIALFIRNGCLKGIMDGTFGYRTGLTIGQAARSIALSLPVWIALGFIIHATVRGLEVLA